MLGSEHGGRNEASATPVSVLALKYGARVEMTSDTEEAYAPFGDDSPCPDEFPSA